MSDECEEALYGLSQIQEKAAGWDDGSALVLAGPGAGKTRVLTKRVARLLQGSPDLHFKVLVLTFTTKAAAEMRERVDTYVPGVAENRTFIGTFHAFCTQTLRQHGSHVNVFPDFGIYDQKREREALLGDALRAAIEAGREFSMEDIAWLNGIDEMKARLVVPEKVGEKIRNPHMPQVYQLYEEALKAENALDFNGLILETCRLLAKVPAVAKRIRHTYPYWMIDEFQDTSPAQYRLLRYMTGGEFKKLFVVADDDQIIYQWAGASYRQIERFREEFQPELIQLVENHRCPAEVVEIANQLVAYNTQRTPDKKETVATREASFEAISFHSFESDIEEREFVAYQILAAGEDVWKEIAVIGRTRSLLEPVLDCLRKKGVTAVLAQRRDNFISPQFVWLQACLDQALRPTNRRVLAVLVNSGNRIADLDFEPPVLIAEAEVSGLSYIEHWSVIARATGNPVAQNLGELVERLANSRSEWSQVVKDAIPLLLETEAVAEGGVGDAVDDQKAWDSCMREIRAELGVNAELSEVVQGLALRSKEPPKDPNTVSLLTVHGSKGLEFQTVYLLGLAEGVMPSWQSVKKGDASAEMEEERRNCFVAITRTEKRLILTAARKYRGWSKDYSRFLGEMHIAD